MISEKVISVCLVLEIGAPNRKPIRAWGRGKYDKFLHGLRPCGLRRRVPRLRPVRCGHQRTPPSIPYLKSAKRWIKSEASVTTSFFWLLVLPLRIENHGGPHCRAYTSKTQDLGKKTATIQSGENLNTRLKTPWAVVYLLSKGLNVSSVP